MELPTELPSCLTRIRQLQLNDRALMDKAAKAFVSYVYSYSKHECNVLLRVKGDCFIPFFKANLELTLETSMVWLLLSIDSFIYSIICLQTWTLVGWPSVSDCSRYPKCPNSRRRIRIFSNLPTWT